LSVQCSQLVAFSRAMATLTLNDHFGSESIKGKSLCMLRNQIC
jgi:hypothetical protein